MKHASARAACSRFLEDQANPPDAEALKGRLEQLERFIGLILRYARRRRLVAESQRNPEELWRHVYDSLQALVVLPRAEPRMLIDAGSGNGLPGIPLALALLETNITLVDRSESKAEFLELAIATLGVQNVSVICSELSRALESVAGEFEVIARALTKPERWPGVLKSITSRPAWITFATESNVPVWERLAKVSGYETKARHDYTLPGTTRVRVILRFEPA